METSGRFEYLNLELDWHSPGFETQGLETDADGRLTLARVPLLAARLGTGQESAPDPQGDDGDALCSDPAPTPTPGGGANTGETVTPVPSGIAVTPACACDVYISDPVRHLIWRWDSCADQPAALPYLRGPDSLPGRLLAPRGLAIVGAPSGPRLYVADSGNHRIQVVDLTTQQPLAVWGQPDPYAAPMPGTQPGRLNDPWGLAVDRAGSVYVVDHGNLRVQKFSARGQVDPTFWQRLAAQPTPPVEPIAIAIAISPNPEGERVYILDRNAGQPRVIVCDTTGAAQGSGPLSADGTSDPTALAVSGDALYVGGADGTLAKLSLSGVPMSVWQSGVRPVAAMAVGCDGELLVGPGGLPVAQVTPDAGFVMHGSFRAGPFGSVAAALAWHRWRVTADPLPLSASGNGTSNGNGGATTYVQLYTYTGDDSTKAPPAAAGDNPFAPDPANALNWFAVPRGELDALILSQKVRDALQAGPPSDPTTDVEGGPPETTYFWLGGLLRGDGTTSPSIRQMRIDYTPSTYLRFLPLTYRTGPRRRLLLDILLAELGSGLDGVEELLAGLPRYFDPAAVPDAALPWLAGWLNFDLIQDWTTATTRTNITGAAALYPWRGTATSLRQYLKVYAGVEARIEEPGEIINTLFCLDDSVSLGFTTRLAPAHEQGAVLASTATLGQSHLLDETDIGVPLFADIAHRFCVQVYVAQLTAPDTLDRVVATIEREKPAHCDYHLCAIDARMRVGFQARIGVDTIIAGPAPDLRLGDPTALGTDTVLAEPHHRASRRVGGGLHVGSTL